METPDSERIDELEKKLKEKDVEIWDLTRKLGSLSEAIQDVWTVVKCIGKDTDNWTPSRKRRGPGKCHCGEWLSDTKHEVVYCEYKPKRSRR